MEIYIIQKLKKDCFKMGGMFYIDRAVEMNSTNIEEREFRRIATKALKGESVSGEKIVDLLSFAGGSFDNLLGGKLENQYKKEEVGTADNPINKIKTYQDNEKNIFSDFSLVAGDEIIFIPFFGYYRNGLFEDGVISYSMIVLKTDNLRIGFLTPEKLLTDYLRIEKTINTSRVV